MDDQEVRIAEALPCPFCDGAAVWAYDPGSWGYSSPKLAIACENEPFSYPYGNGYDKRKHKCFAKTKYIDCEEWRQGKGTYTIKEQTQKALLKLWNQRSPKMIGELAWKLIFDKLAERNAEVIQLRVALRLASNQLEYCGYGGFYGREMDADKQDQLSSLIKSALENDHEQVG